jgi:hypothetical protein
VPPRLIIGASPRQDAVSRENRQTGQPTWKSGQAAPRRPCALFFDQHPSKHPPFLASPFNGGYGGNIEIFSRPAIDLRSLGMSYFQMERNNK